MPTLKIAHIQKQGQDMIIVPLGSEFGQRPIELQNEIICDLEFRAKSAGLKGTVVPVWSHGGRMGFIAPEQWHPFFKSMNLATVYANVNRQLSW